MDYIWLVALNRRVSVCINIIDLISAKAGQKTIDKFEYKNVEHVIAIQCTLYFFYCLL